MGIKLFSSSSNDTNYYHTTSEQLININPDPYKFKIIKKSFKRNNKIAIWVNYPNCINFEGNKVIVLSIKDYNTCIKTGKLDPHFSDRGQTVLARFQPTKKGWRDAIKYTKIN